MAIAWVGLAFQVEGQQRLPQPNVASNQNVPPGRQQAWTAFVGQFNRIDLNYIGLSAQTVLTDFGYPDSHSWQNSTWTYNNLTIYNPAARKTYTTVIFTVYNQHILAAQVY